jgi:hypothetical protein
LLSHKNRLVQPIADHTWAGGESGAKLSILIPGSILMVADIAERGFDYVCLIRGHMQLEDSP